MSGDLDAILDLLEGFDDADDEEGLRATLAGALARFPDSPDLREWKAAIASEEGRFADALVILDRILEAHPDRSWSQLERIAVLIDLGRYHDALASVRLLPPFDDPLERAAVHAQEGVCLDHLGDAAAADAEYRQAEALAPDDYPMPIRLSETRFDALVAEAVDGIPAEFTPYLEQVVIRVRDWPGPDDDPSLMGLYVGVARPDRTVLTEDHLDHVVVFKRAHELHAVDEDELRDEVRRTVVHEIAHHFGIEHEDMGEEYR